MSTPTRPRTTPTLPPELWLRIALFLPSSSLFPLLTLNRLFLDLVIDRAFRDFVLDVDEPGVLGGILGRVWKDPTLPPRILSLTLHPKALRSASLKSAKRTRRTPPRSSTPFPSSSQPQFLETWPRAPHLPEDLHLAASVLTVLAALPSLEAYAVVWQNGTEAESAFCVPLLRAVWGLVLGERGQGQGQAPGNVDVHLGQLGLGNNLHLGRGSKLRTIKLDMSLSHLVAILPRDAPGLARVEDLVVRFSVAATTASQTQNHNHNHHHQQQQHIHPLHPAHAHPHPPNNGNGNGTTHTNGAPPTSAQALHHLASFLSSLRGLRSLRLETSSHVDLSSLFASLSQPLSQTQPQTPTQTQTHSQTHFPHLTNLALSTPCDPGHLSAPAGFNAFLRAHAPGLEEVRWEARWCCSLSSLGPQESGDALLPPQAANGSNTNGANTNANGFNAHADADARTNGAPPRPTTTLAWLDAAFGGLEFPALRVLRVGLNTVGYASSASANGNGHGTNGYGYATHGGNGYGASNGYASNGYTSNGYVNGYGTSSANGYSHSNGYPTSNGHSTPPPNPTGGAQRILMSVPPLLHAARDVERLVIKGCIISLDDLRGLLAPFAPFPVDGTSMSAGKAKTSSKLTTPSTSATNGAHTTQNPATGPRRLTLEVHVLSVELLEVLVWGLPGLCELDLSYRWVGGSGVGEWTQFTSSLRDKTFTPWTRLSQVSLRCTRTDDASRWPCQQAILRCLPKNQPPSTSRY